jgi:hypothetical protein
MNPTWPNPIINSLKISFLKDCDACDPDKKDLGYQEIEVVFQDGGGGLYPVVKTDRFALDESKGTQNFLKFVQDIYKLVNNYNEEAEKE